MPSLPAKSANFIDWYLAVVEAAGLSDKRYPVKGMNVWTPYGFQARRNLDRIFVREIEATGSQAVEFPTLIPETEFAKEKEHIKGFDAEVYWVTRGGATPLDINLVLRPTSETAIYPMFSLWIRSHADLPLNVYQIVNTFRYETKTTRPFVRIREIHFFEEHTCQVDEAAATARVASNLAAFAQMARAMGLPYIAMRRPEWDKFAGAFYSIGFDLLLAEGRALQIGSVHHYRENFSRPYGIQYEARDGSTRFVHQTTFGLSERLIGTAIAAHGDDKGVAFPRALGPYEVVIVPIPGAAAGDAPQRAARAVADRLAGRGLRVHVDDREDRPGSKYYYWELRGVPLRLEIGAREAAAGTASAVDRLGTRRTIPGDRLESDVEAALAAYDEALAARARAEFGTRCTLAASLEDLAGSKTVRQFAWCGSEACGHRIEEAFDGALLGTPEGAPPIDAPMPTRCIAGGETDGLRWAIAGRLL